MGEDDGIGQAMGQTKTGAERIGDRVAAAV